MICRFKLTMFMFFYHISCIFFLFLITWSYDIIIYFIVISAMKFAHTAYIQSKYIQKQVKYYFGKSIYKQSRSFLE